MKKVLLSLGVLAAFTAGSAQATPVRLDGPETNLQQIVNALPGGSSIDVLNDQYVLDEAFTIDGFDPTAKIIVEIAGYQNLNSFGIYDIYDPTKRITLFDGATGAGAITSFLPSGFTTDLFGFYLETPAGVWFSQSGLNADGSDHSVAFKHGSQYLLAWEDLGANSWDQDYNDFVAVVSGVKGVAVPEPASFALLGLGLAGIGVFGGRRKITV